MSADASAPPTPAASSRRSRIGSKGMLILAVALAGVLALAAATQPWVETRLVDGAAAFAALEVTGQKLNPSLSPVALAALASALVLTIAGPVFRRMLGALVLLLGAGVGMLAVTALSDPRGHARGAVAEATGIAGDAQYELVRSAATTGWPVLAAASGAILVIAGVLVLLLSGRWRTGGRKYRASSASSSSAAAHAGAGEPDRVAEWDALSEGDDPS